jgi:hypothetical protein
MRIGLAWDRAPDAMATQVLPNLTAAVRLVADEPVRAALRPTRAPALYLTAGHELWKHHRFMPLARRQGQGQELTRPFRPEVDFGAEAALATPKRFDLEIPFLAPAAC